MLKKDINKYERGYKNSQFNMIKSQKCIYGLREVENSRYNRISEYYFSLDDALNAQKNYRKNKNKRFIITIEETHDSDLTRIQNLIDDTNIHVI